MGTATLDLPDPANDAIGSEAPADDDLLAQLAGEEIDKLLAEAEVEMPPAREDSAPASAASSSENYPAPEQAPTEGEIAEALAESKLRQTSVKEESAAQDTANLGIQPTPDRAADGSTELQEAILGNAVMAETPAAPHTPNPAEILTPAPIEASAPTEPIVSEKASPAPPHETAREVEIAPDGLATRILDFLISPLEACPEPARETFGKIAVITLFNAVAVLIYVLLFRRK